MADDPKVEKLWQGISAERRAAIMASPTPWLEYARERIGVTEIPGPESHWLILAMADAIGLDWYRDDDTPWCMVFVYGCLAAVGLKVRASALAQNARDYGTPLAYPVRGSIGVVPRGSKGWQGHVFFVDSAGGSALRTIDGNSDNRVRIATQRASAIFGDGNRWPPGAEMTPEAKLAAAEYRGETASYGARTLRLHDEGPDVTALQHALTRVGARPALQGLGTFGPKTLEAVRDFQRGQGLVVDGIVGDATAGALAAADIEAERRRDRREAAKPAAAGGAAAGAAAAGGAAAVLSEASGIARVLSDLTVQVESLLAGVDGAVLIGLTGALLIGGAAWLVWSRWKRREAAP